MLLPQPEATMSRQHEAIMLDHQTDTAGLANRIQGHPDKTDLNKETDRVRQKWLDRRNPHFDVA